MKKYENFASQLTVLADAPNQDLANEYVKSGITSKFSLQFELSWKLLKRLLAYEGDPAGEQGSPRGVIKAAYQLYDFIDEDVWLGMLADRNQVSHIYDGDLVDELIQRIIDRYLPEFMRLDAGLRARYGELLELPDDEI